jgi:hypothetical protein
MKLPCYWIEYVEDWRTEPMSYWTHVEQDGRPWLTAEAYSPAAPVRVHGKGFPVLCVEHGATVFRFASEAQIDEFLAIMSSLLLPTTLRLSQLRPGTAGPNSHWLSRLPAVVKSPKGRAGAVKAVMQVVRVMRPNKSFDTDAQGRPRRERRSNSLAAGQVQR